MSQKYMIAQFGAFDINSYGDSLFPTVLKQGLGSDVLVTLFAPTKNLKGYNGNTVFAFSDFEEMHNNMHFDCIVIGGGELFHYAPITFQNSKGQSEYEEGALWKIPLSYANQYNIPVIMNAVGVPYSFTTEQIHELKDMLKNVKCLAVRDRYSYDRLKCFVDSNVLKLVPDTVWGLNNIYSKDDLIAWKGEVARLYQCNLSDPYIVLQYGTTYDLDTLVGQIENYTTAADLNVVVIPVNYVHSDIDEVRAIEEKALTNVMCIKELMQPKDIACVIANAKAFVGTSLHGSLTAMRYGVKCLAIDMYPSIVSKIDGLYEFANKTKWIIQNNSELEEKLCSLMNCDTEMQEYDSKISEANSILKEYYEHILCILSGDTEAVCRDGVANESSTFKKVYVSYENTQNKIISRQYVAQSTNDIYTFYISIEQAQNTEVKLRFILDKPTYIELIETSDSLVLTSENANVDNVYLEREITYAISACSSMDLKVVFKIQDCTLTSRDKAYYELTKNKQMHIQQLIQSERLLMGYKYQFEQLESEHMKNETELETLRRELAEKTALLEQKNIQINNQKGHIEQLLEVDRHYQNIVRSRGWKIVSFPGRVFEKLFPIGTPRRKRISLMVKYIKAFNFTNIKFVCGAFKRGGFKSVKKELNAFEYRMSGATELPLDKPKVVDFDEITSIDMCEKLKFQAYENPKVSIVIPVYNQFTYTYNCLKSIIENSGDVSYEIIIADDVSNDLTTRLSEVAENIHIVRNKENQRFLRNCNNAAQYAKGEYILFLNNDTQVQENWLQPLIDLIERDESIGMVGSKLIYSDGTLQEAGGIIWGPGHAWNYGNGQNPANPEFNYVKEVDYISGASIMIRTSLWREIGGFDEYFAPAYCEDSDLAFEVRKRGYKLMYQPLSVVVHFEGKSNGTDTSTGVKKYQVENSEKLKLKWAEEFKKQSQTESDLFHARERSQNKKTILVIDHYVPQFDKDAGSKTTWQYLKMFVKQGYNVKFMGDNFYQDEPYTTALQQEGIEVLYGPWYAQNYKQWIIDNQNNIDFVYLNRPHITEKYIDFLREETNIKCIYYGHDLHFLRIMREYELNGDESLLQESEDWKKKEFDIMKKAEISYYPSYVEIDEIHKLDDTIPAKAITAYVYEDFKENVSTDFAKKEGLLFVGGFGHPPNEDAVLWFAKEVYPLIKEKQDIPFYIVGSNATDKVKKLAGNGIIMKGFVTEEELSELYETCKLVVVPLRYGAGVKGKVVEALYNGTPMVSTTVGIEGIVDAEKFMAVADDPKEFASAVLELYNDNDKLINTVKNYQDYVKEHNSIEAVWEIIKDDFQ